MTDRALRTVLGAVLPAFWLVVGVVPFVLAWPRLPEPMASHWSLTGAPNGALPRVSMVALHGGVLLLAAIGAWVTTRRASGRPGSVAPALGMAAFMGALFAGLGVLAVLLNLDAPTWRGAGAMRLPWLAAVLLVSGGAGAGANWLARRLEAAHATRAAPRASIGLGATEHATWMATAHNRWLAGLALGLVGAAGVTFVIAPTWSAGVLAISAVVVLTFASIHVSVSERGLRIRLGPWRFPRIAVPLAKIREVRAIDVSPLSRGGWGYRGSLALFGRAAIIVRRGEGLELDLDRGRRLIVTVDDAATAAGLLNDLVARRSPWEIGPVP